MTDVIPHVTPEGLGAAVDADRPETALDEIVRLDAIIQVATERRGQIRDLFAQRPAGWSHESAAGKISLTSPSRRPRIDDDEAFEQWAAETFPDRTRAVDTWDRARVDDLFHARYDNLDGLTEDTAHEARALLLELLESIGATSTEIVLDAKLLGELGKPARSTERPDGTLVLRDTGEQIPGVVMEWASKPQVRPKPDDELVLALAEEIRGRLTPVPTLDTHGDEAQEGDR